MCVCVCVCDMYKYTIILSLVSVQRLFLVVADVFRMAAVDNNARDEKIKLT